MGLKSNNAFMELMDIRSNGIPEEAEVTITGPDPFFVRQLRYRHAEF